MACRGLGFAAWLVQESTINYKLSTINKRKKIWIEIK